MTAVTDQQMDASQRFGWLSQFPVGVQSVIRELSVPKRNPVPRRKRRAAERKVRKAMRRQQKSNA